MAQETNNDFRHILPIQIRFNDVDKFGHVNNTVYFQFYDTAKTDYFATVCKVIKVGNKSFHLEQDIIDSDTQEVKCRCFSVMVLFDLINHQSIPLPAPWREAICQYDGLV